MLRIRHDRLMVFLALIPALAISIALSSCANNSSTGQGGLSNEAGSASEAEMQGETDGLIDTWYVGQPKDDFGDVAEDGEPYLYSYFTGSFSNTATSGSELTGMVVARWDISVTDYMIMFDLREYNDAAATYTSGDEITLKTKTSKGVINEYAMVGNPPNGYVGTVSSQFLKDLLDEPDSLRCIVRIGSSKYEFSVGNNGLKEVLEAYESELPGHIPQQSQEAIKRELQHMLPGNPIAEQKAAALNISQWIKGFEKMEESEVEALFPGTYAFMQFSNLTKSVDSIDFSNYADIREYDGNRKIVKTTRYYDSLRDDFYKIADGYYIVWDTGYYVSGNNGSTGLIAAQLLYACDQNGNPTHSLDV